MKDKSVHSAGNAGRRLSPLVMIMLCLVTLVALGARLLSFPADTPSGGDRSPGGGAGGGALPTAAPGTQDFKPMVSYAVRTDTSAPLREIPALPALGGIGDVEKRLPKSLLRSAPPPNGRDPVLQPPALVAAPMPTPRSNFEGINAAGGCGNCLPPDTNGDVGPNHYFEWVNTSFAIYNKNTGAKIYPANAAAAAGNTLFSGFGGACEASNNGDPIVQYDHLADRWVVSQFAVPGGAAGFHQCVAVSQTGDPIGKYYRYDFAYPFFNDYPKVGVWPDAYYITYNLFGNGVAGAAGAAALERDKMLRGDPTARQVFFNLFSVNPNFGGMLPSDLDGPPPPPGTPNYFAEVDDSAGIGPVDALRIWEFHVDWAAPANSTFGLSGQPNQVLPVADFTPECGAVTGPVNDLEGGCVTQPAGPLLEGLGDRLMYRAAYRSFGDHQALVLIHSVDINGSNHSGQRWYELRKTTGQWSINQQSTYAGDSVADLDNRWMGSMAMDRMGNLALGYSISSSVTFPSIRYAGRLVNDPPNTLAQTETTMIAGAGSQLFTTPRWGDYSMMTVDSTDDCTFFYTQEYFGTANVSLASWQTRIASFRFSSCIDAPQGTLQGKVTDKTNGSPIAGATINAGAYSRSTGASGFYQVINLPAGSYTVTASAPNFGNGTASGVTINSGGTTTQDFALDASGRTPTSAASRKTHGIAGTFDIDLSQTGTPGIECRSGGANGDYQVVVTFAVPVTFTSATVSSGTGSVSSVTTGGNQVFVNLTGVTNAQTIMITLVNVSDGLGTGNVTVPMSVLLGDTTGNGSVNSSDISQTKAQSGTAANATNFRTDVTVNGLINSSDISLVKSKSGTALP